MSSIDDVLRHKKFKHLTSYQVESFMKYGYLRLKRCFTREQAQSFTKDVWVRLGMDPNDKSTWHTEITHMPGHDSVEIKKFAPKAWNAICELAGGEARINTDWCVWWADAFIVNLGSIETEGKTEHPKDLDGWHVDGDFFVHFLDSKEQGLLVIPCWSDVKSNGGATWACIQGPKHVGQWLFDHPQGVDPGMVPIGEEPTDEATELLCDLVKSCDDSAFHEMTGDVGDVLLCHPLMVHSASKNGRRLPRIITNPNICLRKPFQFNRPNPNDYSLIELKTIHDIGQDKLQNWHITGKRAQIVPDRVKQQDAMLKDEQERLESQKLGQNTQNVVVA